MQNTLQSLAQEFNRILAAGDTPVAREQVAARLATALRDPAFIEEQFAGDVPERKIVYEDPALGFCILVHEYKDARIGGPHDHGPHWAIYGQAEGETLMSDFEIVAPASAHAPAKVRKVRSYAMRPGDVKVYNEGDIHAPRREAPTRLVRVEARDMLKVRRGNYVLATD